MPKIVNLVKRKFGVLKVINKSEQKCTGGKTMYTVRCKCGQERTVRGTNLTTGRIKSCGCCKPIPVYNKTKADKMQEKTVKVAKPKTANIQAKNVLVISEKQVESMQIKKDIITPAQVKTDIVEPKEKIENTLKNIWQIATMFDKSVNTIYRMVKDIPDFENNFVIKKSSRKWFINADGVKLIALEINNKK